MKNWKAGPVVRVVQYTNAWGKRTHGVIYEAEARAGLLYKYDQVTDFIQDPVVVWTRSVENAS